MAVWFAVACRRNPGMKSQGGLDAPWLPGRDVWWISGVLVAGRQEGTVQGEGGVAGLLVLAGWSGDGWWYRALEALQVGTLQLAWPVIGVVGGAVSRVGPCIRLDEPDVERVAGLAVVGDRVRVWRWSGTVAALPAGRVAAGRVAIGVQDADPQGRLAFQATFRATRSGCPAMTLM